VTSLLWVLFSARGVCRCRRSGCLVRAGVLDEEPAGLDVVKRDGRVISDDRDECSGEVCQWPVRSAHLRPVEMPAGGHEDCPLMANRSAPQGCGGVGHARSSLI